MEAGGVMFEFCTSIFDKVCSGKMLYNRISNKCGVVVSSDQVARIRSFPSLVMFTLHI